MRIPTLPPKARTAIIIAAWIAVFVLGTANIFVGIGHESLWFDESYSLAAVSHPAREIVPLIAEDFHPPLYFLMLRGFTLVFGRSEAAARSLSALGILALAGLGLFPLRKLWGEWRGLLFSALVFLTPISLAMGQEARMYSWTAFFVTACFLCLRAWRRYGKRGWLVASGLLALASAYSHYYGLMAAAFIWAIVLVELIVRERKRLPEFLIAAAITVAAYAPWLVVLAGQAARVAKHYWIGPLTGKTVLDAAAYPFGFKFWTPPTARALFWGATAVMLYGIAFGSVKKEKNAYDAAMARGAFALTLIGAVVLSSLVRPILVERYMVSCLGLFALALSYGLGSPFPAAQALPAIALYAALNFPIMRLTRIQRLNGPMFEVRREVAFRAKPGDVFIHGSEHTLGVFCYYLPEFRHYLYYPKGAPIYSNHAVFEPAGTSGSDQAAFISSGGSTVWYVNRPGDFTAGPSQAGLEDITLEPSYPARMFAIGNAWFQVNVSSYRIRRENEAGEKK